MSRATAPIGKQLAELKGSDTGRGAFFGNSVSISGTTAIVGAYGQASNAGRAYVFAKTATDWKQVAELRGADTVPVDGFGISVSISGSSAIVGALNHGAGHSGAAYVFAKTPAGWIQLAELKGSDTAAGDFFGTSVAISRTNAIVGAYGHANSAGRAYVFTKSGTGWKQVAELKGSDTVAGDEFGATVAISGSCAIVGAPGHARAYVFTKTGTDWKQVAELKGSDTVAGDEFGGSVAISGTSATVGAFRHASAYVFAKTGAGWNQVAELRGSGDIALFGTSVAISGTTVVVGADFAERAYLFTRRHGGWNQVAELKGSDTVEGPLSVDQFGVSAAISGTLAIVGARFHAKAGRAYVFEA